MTSTDKERNKANELESPDQWDWESGEVVKPRQKRKIRAVVSVAFLAEEHELVAGHAAKLGVKTSTFIRQSALSRAISDVSITSTFWSVGGDGGVFILTDGLVSGTRGAPLLVEPNLKPLEIVFAA